MIIASNVTKRFGKLTALNNVSMKCNRGECIALIGPNGSGKTTLIKSLLGMVVPDSGFITFNDKNIRHNYTYRHQIGYMPQIGRYPENMTIGQVLDMMVDIRQARGKELDEDLIKSFDLTSLRQKRMGALSGGTRQKVSAALAFMFNPAALILDEPTAGLDPLSSELLKEKITREKEKGKLVMITSHVLSDLEDMISHVIYMQDGQVQFHNSFDELRTSTGETRLGRVVASIMTKKGI